MNRGSRARRRPLIWAAAAIAFLAAASVPNTLRAQEESERAAKSRGPNVLYLLVDTLRADHLGAYGYQRDTSPAIDEVARSGVRFARARSQCSWTKASMASLWTGSYPVRTGVLRFQHALPREATMPAEILKEAGFRTGGIWRNGWIANNFGFDQGFDLYFKPAPSRAPEKFERTNPSAHPLLGTDLDITESAIEFLETFGNERFFLYLHMMDVHQYLYDEESAQFGVGYADAYDNAIRWVDKNISVLLARLQEMNLIDDTLIVISSDHGEAFDEHGREGHARDLYGEVTHVPLILRLPGKLPAGVVVPEQVANVDIWPTILDLLDLPNLPSAQGHSLLPLISEPIRTERGYGTSPKATFSQIDRTWGRKDAEPRPLVTITDTGYRLLHPVTGGGRDELYDLATDPGEQTNLAEQQPEKLATLRAKIEQYLKTPPPADWSSREVELDEMHLEQLRALGYDVDADEHQKDN